MKLMEHSKKRVRSQDQSENEENEKSYIAQDDEGQQSTNGGFSNYTTKLQFNNPPLIDVNDKYHPRCLF